MSARVALKHVAQVTVSNVDKKSIGGEQPIRLVNYTDVYYGDRLGPNLNLMTATASHRQIQAFGLQSGDVLITKDSETPDDIGIGAFVEGAAPDMVCGYHLAMLRPRPGQIDGRYLYWSMAGDDARGQLSTGATGVTRYGLRTDVIASTNLWVPKPRKQRAIADYLDTETARIDALITKKRRMIELLEEKWQAHLDSRTCGVGLPLRRVISRFVDYRGATPMKSADGIPLVTASHIKGGVIDHDLEPQFVSKETYAAWMRRGWPERGDVVITTEAPLGEVARIDDPDVALAQRVILLKPAPGTIRSDFLAYCLMSSRFRAVLTANATGSTALGIKADRLRSLPVPCPSLNEQERAGHALARREAQKRDIQRALSRQAELLAEHRQALITSAVTGELEIPVAA